MIEDARQLQQAIEQLGRMYSALSALRADVLPKDPEMFRVMAEGPMEHIDALTREIREYSGAVEFVRLDMDVWFHVQGRGIAWPDAPSSIVTAILDAFRKGVQAVAELSAVGRLNARPTAELSQMCDFPVAAFEPGSIRIGLRVPDATTVERAITQLLEIATWAASEQDEAALARRFAEPSHRRILLNALKPLLPRARGRVDSVEVSGRLAPARRSIVLTRAHHRRVDAAIDRTVDERIEEHDGDLREIDLDARTFVLRHAGDVQEIRCSFGDDVLETAKQALDRRVRVTGARRTIEGRRPQTSLVVTRLDVLDEEERAREDVGSE
jgi:hypothetical protein